MTFRRRQRGSVTWGSCRIDLLRSDRSVKGREMKPECIDDVYEHDPYEGHDEPNWRPVFIVVMILAAILAVSRCFAGDRDRLALAEAEAYAQISQRRVLPNDFEQKQRPAVPRIAIAASSSPEVPAKRHVVVFTSKSCGPCQAMKAANGDGNDQIEYRYVDCEEPRPRDIHSKHWKDSIDLISSGSPIPLTTFYDANDQLRYVSGYLTTRQVMERIDRSSPPPVASAGVGSATIHARQQIRDVIAWFKKYAGGKSEIRWDRTGNQTFPLLSAGTDYSPEAIFGRSGRLEANSPGSLFPVQRIAFGYLIDGDDLTIDADAIRFRGMLAKLRQEQEVSAVDPITLLTIAGALNSLWQLIHPLCDLEIGGNVTCEATLEGEVLLIKFTDCPRIRIKALWQWLLGVQELRISEEQVKLIFEPQRSMFPIRERTFAVEE